MRGTARLVRKAAEHADVVIVYMHAGAEGTGAAHVDAMRVVPRRAARELAVFAHAMIRAGADSCSAPARTCCAGSSGTGSA